MGLSYYSSWGVCVFSHLASRAPGLPKIVSIQNCYNLLARGLFETDLAEA